MMLNVYRHTRTDLSTISDLTINDKPVCNILEDTDRGLKQSDNLDHIMAVKISGKTAIPAGTYEVKLTWSPRFKQVMPELLNVPGFSGVRIHPGNTPADTEGCLLTGEYDPAVQNFVGHSRENYALVYDILSRADDRKEKIMLTIG